MVLTAGLVFLVAPLVLLENTPAVPRPALFIVMAAGLLAMLFGFAVSVRFMRDANSERVAQRGGYRDRIQREYALSVGYMPVASLLLTVLSLRSAWAVLTGQADLHDWGLAAMGPMAALVILQMVAGLGRGQDRRMKRALDEELLRSFRGRALNVGFAVAVVGLVVGFGAGLINPVWGVMSLPIVLATAAAAAALRYAHLDRKADLKG